VFVQEQVAVRCYIPDFGCSSGFGLDYSFELDKYHSHRLGVCMMRLMSHLDFY